MQTIRDKINPDGQGEGGARDLVGESTIGQGNDAKTNHFDRLEFWESTHTQPAFKPVSETNYFRQSGNTYLTSCMEHPFLSDADIKQQKFNRIKELVELAYRQIPVYREKYQAASFAPDQLKSYEDIERIPIITKKELIAAFPHACLNPKFDSADLFPTRSSGSSGETLLIRVNYQAVLDDTIQGIRQFALQSGQKYCADDLLAHVYTVPWWFNNVDDKYRMAFISNVIPPAQVAEYLRSLSPQILSCYPSNLEALLPYAHQFSSSLYLAVTHSEYSSKYARKMWSEKLGCPVLDEYSSEEATRIALEMPCGHYHVCEDAVHLEVLDPLTYVQQKDGESGIAVVTNLLNEAMPFIRYVQGDMITRPACAPPCTINWSQLESIDGRTNDSFINHNGRKVPSGSVLDITYRWMFDRDLHLAQFELIQKQPDLIEANFVLGGPALENRLRGSISHLEDLLSLCLEHNTKVNANIINSFPQTTGKRKPIRCEIKIA